MVGHIISIGLWRIFKTLPEVQLLAQVHDAGLMQIPKGDKITLWKILKLMEVPIPVKGIDGKWRTISIGTEAAIGLNWGHKSDKNPNGIKEVHLDQLEKEVRELGFSPDQWLRGLWGE